MFELVGGNFQCVRGHGGKIFSVFKVKSQMKIKRSNIKYIAI